MCSTATTSPCVCSNIGLNVISCVCVSSCKILSGVYGAHARDSCFNPESTEFVDGKNGRTEWSAENTVSRAADQASLLETAAAALPRSLHPCASLLSARHLPHTHARRSAHGVGGGLLRPLLRTTRESCVLRRPRESEYISVSKGLLYTHLQLCFCLVLIGITTVVGTFYAYIVPYLWQVQHPLLFSLYLLYGHYLLLNVCFHYFKGVYTDPGSAPKVTNAHAHTHTLPSLVYMCIDCCRCGWYDKTRETEERMDFLQVLCVSVCVTISFTVHACSSLSIVCVCV